MESVWQDLRYALRQLREDRGFSIAAILTLALGIGATACILMVVNTVLLKELPYARPERLVVLQGGYRDNGTLSSAALSQQDVADWRERSKAFSAVSVEGTLPFNLEQGALSQHLTAELVNYDYFALLGVDPMLGRFFTAEEDAKPLERFVVVLGYDLWRRSFGADPGVVGSKLQFNGRVYQVVGVGPRGFHGLSDEADIWVPSMLPPIPQFITDRGTRWVTAVARLKPGVSVRQAQEQLDAVTANLAREFPIFDNGLGAIVTPIKDFWFGDLRRGLLALTAGALILLLIACINVASLLLIRAAANQRVWAVRVALGASRRRLARQLVTESVLLSVIGAAAGLLLAQWASRALIAVSGARFPSFVHVGAEPGLVAAVVGLAMLCGVAFGLAPIWVSFRADLTHSLGRDDKAQPRGKRWHWFQSTVVVAQVALALTLGTYAVLMAKSFQNIMAQNLGFRADNLLTTRIDPRGPKYFDPNGVTKLLREQYLPRVEAIPGVAQVALADPTIPTDGSVSNNIAVEDHDSDRPGGTYDGLIHAVSPGYFDILGIPIVRGRAFTMQDVQSNSVIVSKAMADQAWPGKDPIGKRIKMGLRALPLPWLTVVGVVAEVRYEGLVGERETAPAIYLPLVQFIYRPPLTINFLVRPKPGVTTLQLRQALHREILAIDPELPDYDMATLQERLLKQTDKARFQVILIAVFTVLALVLVAVGIYGVVSYTVAQRVREIAIRMSVGADRDSILRLVVGRGALLAAAGLALGLVAVLSFSGLMVSLLFQTRITDPLILGSTSLGLFLVTLAANYLPARRAARLDPMAGLRS
jgi:predicted permease